MKVQYFPSAAAFRAWLLSYHATTTELWVGFYKKSSGQSGVTYREAVDEALCFGWVDSLIKRLDNDRYAIKVTPRSETSKWSDINRKRWKRLKAAGRLAPSGVAAAPTANRYAPRPRIPELPGYIAKAFKAHRSAWQHFRALARTSRRDFVVWIHLAKRPETRQRRIRESLELLTAGKKLGLK